MNVARTHGVNALFFDAILSGDLDTAEQALEIRRSLGVGSVPLVDTIVHRLVWHSAQMDWPDWCGPAMSAAARICCGNEGLMNLARWLYAESRTVEIPEPLFLFTDPVTPGYIVMRGLRSLDEDARGRVRTALVTCYSERTGEPLS